MKAVRERNKDRAKLTLSNWVRRVFMLFELSSQQCSRCDPIANGLQLETAQRRGFLVEPLPPELTASRVADRLRMPDDVVGPTFRILADLKCIEIASLSYGRPTVWRLASGARMPSVKAVQTSALRKPSKAWPGFA